MAAPATGTPTTNTPTITTAGPAPLLDLGGRRYDLTHRALVMGILNRTPDSFYDKGATFELDKLYGRAEQLVADGADILDIGGVKAGPGPEVTEAEELERVVPVVAGLVARFDTPVSVDTWRATVAEAATLSCGNRAVSCRACSSANPSVGNSTGYLPAVSVVPWRILPSGRLTSIGLATTGAPY